MKRRSKAAGEPIKGRRNKSPEPKRSNASKAVARSKSSSAGKEKKRGNHGQIGAGEPTTSWAALSDRARCSHWLARSAPKLPRARAPWPSAPAIACFTGPAFVGMIQPKHKKHARTGAFAS